ncbi:MAG: apolipoprotein N-acyltransferase [Verrucomicrobiota bacterium]
MAGRMGWLRLMAVIASGLMTAAVFVPYDQAWLVWVSLVPMMAVMWSLGGRRVGWKGFGLGWLAGLVGFGIQFSWLSVVSPLGAVVLALYLAVYPAIFGWFCATWGNPFRSRLGCVPLAIVHGAVWAGLELLRGWVFTGFGWNGLGVAFHETPIMAQAADVFGVTGLSALIVFVQSVLTQFMARVMSNRGSWRVADLRPLAVAVLAVALCAIYGVLRIRNENDRESIPLKALLVQINIPQDAARVLWEPLAVHMAYEEETLKALESLKAADPTGANLPDWVVWPESALTGRILRTDDGDWGMWQENIETISQVRKGGRFHLIHGTNELEAEVIEDGQLVMKPSGRAWNLIAFMSPQDELQTYRKKHLVIFGETIPFVDSIPLLKKIYAQQAGVEYGGSFTPGDSFEPVKVPNLGGQEIGAIPSVCFEDTVPRLTRKFVRSEPQVIVNVTNDGWFKESAAAAQHFANAKFRAIELRRPMIRCANSGVSAAVDTTGKAQVLVDANGSHFTRGSLLVDVAVPKNASFSLYALMGDWPVAIGALLALGWARRRKK